MRERSRRASPRTDYVKLPGDAGSDLETKTHTQRASFVATYHARVCSKQQSVIVPGSDAWLRKRPREAPRHISRGQTRVSQRRLGCLSLGPSEVHSACRFAAPDTAVVNVVLSFLSPKTSHGRKQTNDPSTISASDFAQEACCDFARTTAVDLFLRPDQNLKLGMGFA